MYIYISMYIYAHIIHMFVRMNVHTNNIFIISTHNMYTYMQFLYIYLHNVYVHTHTHTHTHPHAPVIAE